MERIKDSKGITLVVLIITVIIMLILASVATYTGIDTYKQARVMEYVQQMQLIQSKVDEIVGASNQEELLNLGAEITTSEQIDAIDSAYENGEVTSNDKNTYRYLSKNDLNNILSIDDSSDDVMINFETREVVSVNDVKYNGVTYHTQYKLPGGQTIIINKEDNNREVSFETELLIDGLNATVKITDVSITNGTLKFSEAVEDENSDNWKIITNYAEKDKEYKASVSKSGNYTFVIQDNMDKSKVSEQKVKITLANKPKTSLDLDEYNYGVDSTYWAYMQNSSGEYYAWIPRFAYDKDNNIKFVKGNSNIATDNSYLDDTWEVHEKFVRRRWNRSYRYMD